MKTIQVAAIIHENVRILTTQRGYGEYKGMWEFPGGKMELGETEEQAIVREIREERMPMCVVTKGMDFLFQ